MAIKRPKTPIEQHQKVTLNEGSIVMANRINASIEITIGRMNIKKTDESIAVAKQASKVNSETRLNRLFLLGFSVQLGSVI